MAKREEMPAVRPNGMSDAKWAKLRQRAVDRMRESPGRSWRFLCQGTREHEYFTIDSKGAPAPFDELVVDDWFHIEQMDTRAWWMQVGDCMFWITVPRKGPVRISLTEGKLHEPK